MKYSVLLAFLLFAVAYSSFDFTHHQNGHELVVTLKDETSKIWVVFVESSPSDNDELRKNNRELKDAVKQKIYNEDVYFTSVDLTDEESQEKYKEFTDMVKIDLDLLKEGPIVALVFDKKGYWIHGHGIPEETVDIIHAFVEQKKEEKSKHEPVKVGGKVKHPSSFESFRGNGGY